MVLVNGVLARQGLVRRWIRQVNVAFGHGNPHQIACLSSFTSIQNREGNKHVVSLKSKPTSGREAGVARKGQRAIKSELKLLSHRYEFKPFQAVIVGRPNVGKSTIFNRLVKQRKAIVSNIPGTTRDRRDGVAQLGEMGFTVTDTGGFEDVSHYDEKLSVSGQHGPELISSMLRQTSEALRDATVALFVVDAKQGIVPEDEVFARWIRREMGASIDSPERGVVLIANKSEGLGEAFEWGDDSNEHWERFLIDCHRLGFGDPVPLSAEHGQGIGDLYRALERFGKVDADLEKRDEHMKRPLDKHDDHAKDSPSHGIVLEKEKDDDDTVQVAMIGRPNVGKSTLLNCLIGKERVITGPVAGLTRDAISVEWNYGDRKIRLVDTAGIRKRTKLYGERAELARNPAKSDGQGELRSPKASEAMLEDFSISDSLRAIDHSQVVVFLVDVAATKDDPDANGPMTKHDLAILGRILDEGRGLVVAANKCDLTRNADGFPGAENSEQSAIANWINKQISDAVPLGRDVSVVPISALEKTGVDELMPTILATYDRWRTRISTSKLNEWLRQAVFENPPPAFAGKYIQKQRGSAPLKIKYITQPSSRPPTFILFVNRRRPTSNTVPEAYLRYLTNRLRRDFQLHGIPIRLFIRGSEGAKPSS